MKSTSISMPAGSYGIALVLNFANKEQAGITGMKKK
jgi:hypothetical protein